MEKQRNKTINFNLHFILFYINLLCIKNFRMNKERNKTTTKQYLNFILQKMYIPGNKDFSGDVKNQ